MSGKSKIAGVVVTAIVLGSGVWWTSKQGAIAAIPAARETRFTTEEINRLTGGRVYKTPISFSPGVYTMYAWAEEWDKNAAAPKITVLGAVSAEMSAKAAGIPDAIIFMRPIPSEENFGLVAGPFSWHGKFQMNGTDGGMTALMPPVDANMAGKDIPLAKVVPHVKDSADTGISTESKPQPHAEVTYLFWARFEPGRNSDLGSTGAEWVGGRVEFKH